MKITQKYALLLAILTIGSMGTGLANDDNSGNQPENQSLFQKAWTKIKNNKGKIIAAGCAIAAIGLGYWYHENLYNFGSNLFSPELKTFKYKSVDDLRKALNKKGEINEIEEYRLKKIKTMNDLEIFAEKLATKYDLMHNLGIDQYEKNHSHKFDAHERHQIEVFIKQLNDLDEQSKKIPTMPDRLIGKIVWNPNTGEIISKVSF